MPMVISSTKQTRREAKVDETRTTASEGAALPGLRGVDHVGITVPDMEQATAFFVDVLGCELLYEREPPGDDSPRDRLGVPAGTRIQAVRFLRCANGANIELFEFASPDQREDFPRPSDVGIQHLALYVDDLDAAAEHLRRHGVKLMSGPNPLPGPEAGEGNQFIYARTPWGLTVELISYPAPMAYQQRSDARRWRPMPPDR
jgi:catechol 2,3-dioxygenase-like lactoylglutathione lyase family enzyme